MVKQDSKRNIIHVEATAKITKERKAVIILNCNMVLNLKKSDQL